MRAGLERARDALILTPAIFMFAIWTYFLSPVVRMDTVPTYLAMATVMSFGIAYSIRLFISALRHEKK